MAPRGLASRLPSEVRAWLEAELVRRGFSDYSSIADELNRRLAEAGEPETSRASVHRFGQTVEERIEALRRTTEIAQTLAREAGDDEGVMNDALVRLTQQRIFDVMLSLEVDPEDVDLATLGRTVAQLTRASVDQKKHQLETRKKLEEKLAKLDEEAKGGGKGLDAETLRRVREAFYGVV